MKHVAAVAAKWFAVVAAVLGFWATPAFAAAETQPQKLTDAELAVFLLISGVVGVFMPDTAGKSLEQIEAERAPA